MPLIVVGSSEEKQQYLGENAYKFDWLIDDMGATIDSPEAQGVNRMCFSAPWNFSAKNATARVKNWSEIMKFFFAPGPQVTAGPERSKWLTLHSTPEVVR